jgi:ABC-type nitrate/sulfonate/bicarbonate transport system substrate-binding protein
VNKRITIIIVAAVVIVVAVVAVVAAASGHKSSTDSKSGLFTIRYPTLLFSDPVYVADELGYFKDEGIKVDFTGSEQDVVTPVATGADDFGGTHASWITVAIAKGFKIKVIAAGWASTKENPVYAWVVKANSSIKTPKDLVGKTVAETPRDYNFLELLSKYGISEKQVHIVTLPFDKQEQALRSGQVDAIGLLEPFLQKALQGGGLRQLSSTADVVGDEQGWPQQFVNTDFLKKHPDIVRGFVRAYAKATDWARAHPGEAGKIFAKRLGAPVAYAKYYTAAYPKHALVDEADAKLWLDIVVKYGDVKPGQLTTSDIYTNEFNSYYEK